MADVPSRVAQLVETFDHLVYALRGLTEEEIKIVEQSAPGS